jgi:hypothetical protein
MEVVGRVELDRNGNGSFKFRRMSPDPPVVVQPGAATMTPPTVDEVHAKILADGWQIHASRIPLTNNDVKIQVSNVQRQHALNLIPGPNGTWSVAAWQRLMSVLSKEKGSKFKQNNAMLALPAPEMLALPAPEVLTEVSPVVPPEVSPDEPEPEEDAVDSDHSDSDSGSDSGSDSDDSEKDKKKVHVDMVQVLQQEKQQLLLRIGDVEDEMASRAHQNYTISKV